MKFILNKQIKCCTKEWFKLINLVAIALFIIMTVIFMKYKLVCSVSISGEHIGYVQNKELVEEKVNDMLALEGKNNIAFVDCIVPEYNLTFINNNIDVNDNSVLAKIEENTKMTYKYYAVTLNGKQKSVVDSLEEAEKLVTDMKEKYEDNIKFTIGINELYTQDSNEYETVDIKVASKEVNTELKKIGYDIGQSETPITPVILGDEKLAQSFAKRLIEEGVYVKPIVFPTVPLGTGRVRNMPTAAHTKEMLDNAVAIYEKVGKEMGII